MSAPVMGAVFLQNFLEKNRIYITSAKSDSLRT